MNFLNRLRDRYFPPFKPLSPGVFTYSPPPDSGVPYRLHLRIEPDGHGILVVNGSTVLHLNQTATEYAYHLVKNTPLEESAKAISSRYGISPVQARADYGELVERLETLIATPDLDPVAYLDLERVDPYPSEIFAPYRIDCALTYRLPESTLIHFAPVERVKRELIQTEWETVLRKAWDAGIPHAVFTGGEPTLRPDLVDLITFASQLGMVTGLITDGLRLAERDYLHNVLQSGLDHLMLVLSPKNEQAWEALRDLLAEDISVTVHLTLTGQESIDVNLLDRLVGTGVKKLSLSAAAPSLHPLLSLLRQQAADRGLSLVWDLPVPYSQANPIALELADSDEKPNRASGAYLYVEPDGDVLLAQGERRVLGNLLTSDWAAVWEARAG